MRTPWGCSPQTLARGTRGSGALHGGGRCWPGGCAVLPGATRPRPAPEECEAGARCIVRGGAGAEGVPCILSSAAVLPGAARPRPSPEGRSTVVRYTVGGGADAEGVPLSHFSLPCRLGLLAPDPRQRAVTRQPSGHPRAGASPLDPKAAADILVSADTFYFRKGYCHALTESVGSQRHRRPLCLSAWS